MRAFLFLIFLISTSSFAQQIEPPKAYVKYTTEKIIIDGKVDEQAWKDAQPTSDFWQWFPTDSLKATQQTEMRFLMDDKNIYLLFKSYSESSDYVVPSLRRDFQGSGNDNNTFLFDTFLDKTNAFFFGTNPMGIQREALIANGGNNYGTDANLSWDVVWETEAQTYDGYYISEIKIPFSSLNFPEGSTKWRFNMYRFDTHTAEWTIWSRVPQNQQLINLAFLGELIFEKPLGKSKNPVAIIPYVSSAVNENYQDASQNFTNGNVGIDAKVPLGSNGMLMDITINPDFSQVEVDDQIVNLSRFAVSLPEKRQFFIQNSDLFTNFGDRREQQPFFSRRIGIARDISGNTIENKIIGGVRISGKVNDDLRLGFLSMQTREDIPNEIPTNNNTVFTLQQKVFERSNISMLFINRQATKNYDFLTEEERFNRVLGIDYNLATKSNVWTGRFWLHKSFRPVVDNQDFSGGFNINYNTRKHQFFAATMFIEKNFKSDLGFNRRTNLLKIPASYTYRIWSPTKNINRIQLSQLGIHFYENDSHRLTDHFYRTRANIQFLDRSELDFSFNKQFTFLDNEFDPTRSGGDAIKLPANSSYHYNNFSASYRSDNRKELFYFIQADRGTFYNGTKTSARLNLSWRVQPHFFTTLQASYDGIQLPAPYPSADIWLITPRIDITFSKKIFWATFIQYNTQGESLGINSRLQWRFKPLSDLFLVYTDNYIASDVFAPRQRSINFKFTYWLNL